MADVYVKAAGELGYPRQDLNGYYTEGIYFNVIIAKNTWMCKYAYIYLTGFDTIFYPIKNGRRFGVYGENKILRIKYIKEID